MQVFHDQTLDQWKTCHPGQCVTQFEVASLIRTAYNKAASIRNASNAFENSGCWVISRFVFDNDDFAASNHLNIANNEYEEESSLKLL
jgi:hypothetical protein